MTHKYKPSDILSRLPAGKASAPLAQITEEDLTAAWSRPAMLFLLADRLQEEGFVHCAWIASRHGTNLWLEQIQPGVPVNHEMWKLAAHYGHDVTMEDIAKRVYPHHTFDTALPQPWVDATSQWSPLDLATRCVWGYGSQNTVVGCPLPLTQLAAEFLTSRVA